ncbi:hypothetical protein F5Y19DRAFT_234405 [Xylariaceae sp. FL1651]|nr:hypothetical protein F5Y19DRAFT_234405 [Xylariaceae sp. FL1651]
MAPDEATRPAVVSVQKLAIIYRDYLISSMDRYFFLLLSFHLPLRDERWWICKTITALMQHALSLLSLTALACQASASRISVPIQTEDGAVFALSSPSPTPTPSWYASAQLLKRGDYMLRHDTCGFGSADPYVTYKCYSSVGQCENIGSYRGCCTGDLESCSSTFWTQCDDYNPSSICGSFLKTRCCQSLAPYCIAWQFATDENTYTAWDCDTQWEHRPLSLAVAAAFFHPLLRHTIK